MEECTSSQQEDEETREFLPGYKTFGDYSKALLCQVMSAAKSSNGLPEEGDDYDYYMSFPGYSNFCSKMATRINRMISKIVRHQQLPCYWEMKPEVGGASGVTQLEEKFEVLIEANDILLEKTNVLLDEVAGLRKNIDQPILSGDALQKGTVEVASWSNKVDSVRKQVGVFKFIHSRNVTRPQVKFRDQVDNSNNPFIPRIRGKPNARIPLPEVYQKLEDSTSLSALIANTKEWVGSELWSVHPYQFELENFEPIPEQLQLQEPQQPGVIEDTPMTYIDSLAQLEALRDDLKRVKEFAIDLEHHSYRSFLGFTCLMQLSTRNHDYIIDTLVVRHHMHTLLDPFTDPSIVKVMHGADSDVEWLQKDFGLYLVNLFDTGQASRILQLPKFSLSFLLHYCCQVEADKQYQLADWRIRPLPIEMEQYAREDTHYLLYIYDRMKNELIRRGDRTNHLLHTVLRRSMDICLRQYKKPTFSENSYLELYHKHKRRFNSRQLLCLKLLYMWRDRLARDEDESPGYVLPNHMLFQISEILPREIGGVLACCNPIPILLRQQQHEVFFLVQQARDSPLTNQLPTMEMGSKFGGGEEQKVEGGEAVAMEVDGSADSQNIPTSFTSVVITCLPVKAGRPVATVFEEVVTKSSLADEKVMEVKCSTSKFLDQFQPVKEMTPSEVLMQQQLAYETLAASNRMKSQPSLHPLPSSEQPSPIMKGLDVIKKIDSSRTKLSVREMGQEKSPHLERLNKKPRLSHDTMRDFEPFQYQDSNYNDYTQGEDGDVEVYDPHRTIGDKGKKESFPAPPRSRVQQKSGHKSQTYRARHRRNQ